MLNRVIVLQHVEKGTKLVLEQIVTTTATVADAAEEHFVSYYDRFMPRLECSWSYLLTAQCNYTHLLHFQSIP